MGTPRINQQNENHEGISASRDGRGVGAWIRGLRDRILGKWKNLKSFFTKKTVEQPNVVQPSAVLEHRFIRWSETMGNGDTSVSQNDPPPPYEFPPSYIIATHSNYPSFHKYNANNQEGSTISDRMGNENATMHSP